MGSLVKNEQKPEATLSQEAAKQMLSNVFEACEYEHNRIPMEVLQSYSAYRRERYLLQRGVLVVVLLLFLLLPVLFFSADVELSWVADAEPGRPVVEMTVDSMLPIESITADIGGVPLEVYHNSEETYRIHPSRNGVLTVIVTLTNKQFTLRTMEVTEVDQRAPEVISHKLEKGELTIVFRDNASQLDYENIYAMDTSGNLLYPLRWDEQNMTVVFGVEQADLNIFVTDEYGNRLQLVLKVE